MSKMHQVLIAATIMLAAAPFALSQRPRSATQTSNDPSTSIRTPPAAPPTVKAKYEGGVFGYKKRFDGTLNFDDTNQRLIFRDGNGKDTGIFLPYKSITGAYADSHKVRPAAATVAGQVPYTWPAGFFRKKVQYLTIQYDDPDSHVGGVTSFKLDNKDILDSVLYTLANKSGLDRRGEVFIRKRP